MLRTTQKILFILSTDRHRHGVDRVNVDPGECQAPVRESAGIEGPQACPRGLRHSWGVAAVQAGIPLTTIAAVLEHADVSTTAIYTTAIGAEARELVSRVWRD